MWTQQNNRGGKDPALLVTTLSACMNKAVTEGYSEYFKVTARGLYAISKSRYYRPEQIQLMDTYRCDTQNMAGKETLVYAIEASDGVKGTLVDDSGGFSDPGINKFIAEAEEIRRQYTEHNKNIC